jgi:hypothetical protein
MSSLTITASAAGAWLWEQFSTPIAARAKGELKERWDQFKWKAAAEAYRKKIKTLHGTMQVMGMPRPVPLDDIFTDLYMLDKPTAFARFDIERLTTMSSDSKDRPVAERTNGLRLVVEKGKCNELPTEGKLKRALRTVDSTVYRAFDSKVQRTVLALHRIEETDKSSEAPSQPKDETGGNLFILGKPGAGKTTFLKYIALKAAEQTIDKVPIFISLKEWADSGLGLWPFILIQFDICDFPAAEPFVKELLRIGNAIVLFDGLDEVNQMSGDRDKQVTAIKDFAHKYNRAQCLITCRLAANDYTFTPFEYVEIADFGPEQIERFVSNWFRDNEGDKDEKTCRRFLTDFSLPENTGLRDLARTPLLLTLLCLAFNETLTFPRRKVEIYEEAVEALLKRWDATRRIKRDDIYRKLSPGHKENMLATIAAATYDKNQYFIPQHELEKLIVDYMHNVPPHRKNERFSGETILQAIAAQHGIFVERAHKIYSFSHLTLQEYFTARHIVTSPRTFTLHDLVMKGCRDDRWREVFLLTTSLLADASKFMRTFRSAIDGLFRNDEKFWALFAWANKQSTNATCPWLTRLRLLEEQNLGHFDGVIIDYYRACYVANELGLDALSETLTSLSFPASVDAISEWGEFENSLRVISRECKLDSKPAFDERQGSQLTIYLKATALFKDCLHLAFMDPEEKKTMLDGLCLPPAKYVTST